MPLVEHGTGDNFTEVGAEVSSLVNTALEDSYVGVCGFNFSAEDVKSISLNFTRQVAAFVIFAVLVRVL